jgi:PKD repeat protein
VANFSISKSSERAPSVITIDASQSTDADSTIVSYGLSVNGELTTQSTPVFTIDANSAASFNLILTVTDSQGLSNQKTDSFEILPALVAPVASISVNPTTGRVPLDVVIDASNSMDSDGSIVKYDLSINGELISQTTPVFNFNVTEANTYNLSLTVTDSDGLTNTTTQAVTYDPALVAPIASFTINPISGRVPLDVVVDAGASSDSDGTIAKYDLYVNENLVSQTTPIFNLNVDEAATLNLRLVVTDNDGLTSESIKTVTYEAPLVTPVASLSATPSEAEVPFEVTLDASNSTDADGTIVNYVFLMEQMLSHQLVQL